MVSTRLVVAVCSMVLLTGAVVALRLDRDVEATWLLAAGSGGGTFWAVLGFAWSADNPTMLSSGSYFALATTGLLVTGFLFLRAVEGRPLG